MSFDNWIAMITAFISTATVIVMALQIRSNIKLTRNNQTFQKIYELDHLLYHPSRFKKIIKKIGMTNDRKSPLSIFDASLLNKKYKYEIYELLNFFETLSAAVFSKNIDNTIFFNIYGLRICNAYEKLHPFIILAADKYKNPEKKPYQHFSMLYEHYKRNMEENHGHRKSAFSFKKGGKHN